MLGELADTVEEEEEIEDELEDEEPCNFPFPFLTKGIFDLDPCPFCDKAYDVRCACLSEELLVLLLRLALDDRTEF